MKNPYDTALGTRDPVASMGDAPERIRSLVSGMSDGDFTRPLGAGKWTVAQVLDHLAQMELVFGLRVRMALTTLGYVAQSVDQDEMMAREGPHSGREGFDAYYAMRRWNLPLFRSLTPEQRGRRFTHPERGEMTIEDLMALFAGHELHHLNQLEQAVRR